MAQTSVHIKAAKSGAQEHNERTRKLDHVRHDLTPNNKNWHASGYTGNSVLMDKIKTDYQDAHQKKLHAKATPIREGVVVIQKGTTMAQLLAAAKECETDFGIQVQAISMHMDEGHYKDNGEWVGNYHAHVTWCWYNWQSHTTCKLNRDDTAHMQDIFAKALSMERGLSSTKKGLSAIQFKVQKKQEQLAALEQQGKLYTAKAAKLQADISALQEREAAALEKAQAAEKAASREQLRSNAADVGARVLGLLGRGAVAEANAKAEQATQVANNAVKRAAAEIQKRKEAEKAQIQAFLAQKKAERGEQQAKEEKDAYGREKYDKGHAAGCAAGKNEMAAKIALVQKQLEETQAELEQIKYYNPNMRHLKQCLKDMQTAGINDTDARKIFMNGRATIQLNIKYNYKDYPIETEVGIGNNKQTNTVGLWFRAAFDNTWHNVHVFIEKAINHIRQIHQSHGIKF